MKLFFSKYCNDFKDELDVSFQTKWDLCNVGEVPLIYDTEGLIDLMMTVWVQKAKNPFGFDITFYLIDGEKKHVEEFNTYTFAHGAFMMKMIEAKEKEMKNRWLLENYLSNSKRA